MLDSLIENYNTSIHSSLGKSPARALADPFDETSVYQEVKRAIKTGKAQKQRWHRDEIVVGSKVRYLLPSATFSKRTKSRWSRAVYEVYKIEQNAFFYLDISEDDDDDIITVKRNLESTNFSWLMPRTFKMHQYKMISDGDDREEYQEEQRYNRRWNREGLDELDAEELPQRNRRPD